MYSALWKFCIFVSSILCLLTWADSNQDNVFGPFQLSISKLALCKRGLKSIDCGVTKITLTAVNGSILQGMLVVRENLRSVKTKIVGTSNGRQLVRMQVDNICQNMKLKLLFEYALKMTKDCTIVKGTYNFSLDLNKLMNEFHGGKFAYGNIVFKHNFYTEKCDYLCVILGIAFVPKKV